MECKQKDLLAQSPLKAMFKVWPLNVEVWVLGGCVTAEHLEHCHGKNCRSSGPGSLIIKRTHSAGLGWLGWVGISYCDGDTGLPSAYTHQYCHEYQVDIRTQKLPPALLHYLSTLSCHLWISQQEENLMKPVLFSLCLSVELSTKIRERH